MSGHLVLIKQDRHGCFTMARFPHELRDSVEDTAKKLWNDDSRFKIIEDKDIRFLAGET